MRLSFNRTILIFLLFSWVTSPVCSQNRKVYNLADYDLAPYHFGFTLGVNQMLFTIKTIPDFQSKQFNAIESPDVNAPSSKLYSVEHNPSVGFTIGIVSNLRLHENWDLRFIPSLSFGQRDLVYQISLIDGIETKTKQVQSTYVEFPLHFKYKGSRYNNIRPYWLIGSKYTLDMASDSKKQESGANPSNVALTKHDIYGELGAGMDFYTAFFKFGVELKMAYGLKDILRRENNIYTSTIDHLNSKIFYVSFTFE